MVFNARFLVSAVLSAGLAAGTMNTHIAPASAANARATTPTLEQEYYMLDYAEKGKVSFLGISVQSMAGKIPVGTVLHLRAWGAGGNRIPMSADSLTSLTTVKSARTAWLAGRLEQPSRQDFLSVEVAYRSPNGQRKVLSNVIEDPSLNNGCEARPTRHAALLHGQPCVVTRSTNVPPLSDAPCASLARQRSKKVAPATR